VGLFSGGAVTRMVLEAGAGCCIMLSIVCVIRYAPSANASKVALRLKNIFLSNNAIHCTIVRGILNER